VIMGGADLVLIGADGMLGTACMQLLARRAVPVRALYLPSFDLLREADITGLELAGVRAVINCSGWTDVDGAEANEAGATALNGTAVGMLAERCGEAGSLLVHYGTDYVFAGDAREPYPVHAPHAPASAYGRSKADGERRIWASGARALVVRTSWLYAPWAKNFVRTIAMLAKTKPELKVVDDQRGRPTSAEHLAATTWTLVERNVAGVVHVTDGGECTWFDFATAIAAKVNPECRVLPCTTAEFPRPARRPAYSVLDVAKTEALVGPMPRWQDAVADVLDRLEPLSI
jgi:dTDP-4-dehydrorhamnose reductase